LIEYWVFFPRLHYIFKSVHTCFVVKLLRFLKPTIRRP